jgi:hypothetical protein
MRIVFLFCFKGRDLGNRVKPSVLHEHERFSETGHKKKERQGNEYVCQ